MSADHPIQHIRKSALTLADSPWCELLFELHRANPGFRPFVVDTGERASPNVVHQRIEQELSTGRNGADPSVGNNCLRDSDQGATLRAFEPRRGLAAIKCCYGALACPIGVLLQIEVAIERFGEAAMFNTELEGFPIATGSNKERHLHLLKKG